MAEGYGFCAKNGRRGHSLLMGGCAVYRDWPRFWRRYRPCVSCDAKVPVGEPLPPTTDEWLGASDG